MIELDMLAALTLALAIAIYLSRRSKSCLGGSPPPPRAIEP
jgi:hypothetical protein